MSGRLELRAEWSYCGFLVSTAQDQLTYRRSVVITALNLRISLCDWRHPRICANETAREDVPSAEQSMMLAVAAHPLVCPPSCVTGLFQPLHNRTLVPAMPLKYQQYLHLLHSKGHSDTVTSIAFSPSGLLLASGSLDGRVCVWDINTSKLRYVFSGKSAVLSILWAPPGDCHVVCGMENGTIASLLISAVHRQ